MYWLELSAPFLITSKVGFGTWMNSGSCVVGNTGGTMPIKSLPLPTLLCGPHSCGNMVHPPAVLTSLPPLHIPRQPPDTIFLSSYSFFLPYPLSLPSCGFSSLSHSLPLSGRHRSSWSYRFPWRWGWWRRARSSRSTSKNMSVSELDNYCVVLYTYQLADNAQY